MQARNQYLGVLRKRHLRARAKKAKAQILDEYCRNMGQAGSMSSEICSPDRPEAKAEEEEERDLRWPSHRGSSQSMKIFDCPCGQRLKPIREVGLARLTLSNCRQHNRRNSCVHDSWGLLALALFRLSFKSGLRVSRDCRTQVETCYGDKLSRQSRAGLKEVCKRLLCMVTLSTDAQMIYALNGFEFILFLELLLGSQRRNKASIRSAAARFLQRQQ